MTATANGHAGKRKADDITLDEVDGFSAAQLFGKGVCYTYDDVIFHPGHIDFGAPEVELTTKLTRNISIRTPIVSSPMDTVTESDMAIAMASVGGAGFLHYNMTQEEQVAHLKVVKAHRLGYVTRPEVRGPDATLAECDALATSRGFTSVVVTDTGIVGGKLLGLVSSRDGDLAMDRSTKLKDVMTKAAEIGRASCRERV